MSTCPARYGSVTKVARLISELPFSSKSICKCSSTTDKSAVNAMLCCFLTSKKVEQTRVAVWGDGGRCVLQASCWWCVLVKGSLAVVMFVESCSKRLFVAVVLSCRTYSVSSISGASSSIAFSLQAVAEKPFPTLPEMTRQRSASYSCIAS